MEGQEKYASYLFEDFLQDGFFIESVKKPTDERIAFWNRFLEDYPEQSDIYHAAQAFIEDLVYPQIQDEEIAEMWANIQSKSKPSRRSVRMRRIAYTAIAIAASILALVVARIFFIQNDHHLLRNDILSFVANSADSISNSGEIQLILSEQKTIYLQGKETMITYDSASIHTHCGEIPKNETASYNRLVVPYGKSSVLILHDGTKVWINAGTNLVYPVEFEADKREIYVNGEIFLDVAPDAGRPFIVRTNDISITVVGTRFNVQAYSSDEQSRIALESGLVKITSEIIGKVLLHPNQIYEQDRKGKSSVKDDVVGKYTSWIHGLYMYESERLDIILKRLERYYGTEIVVESSVSELRCSGKLDLKENIEDVLSIINKTAPIEYFKNSDKFFVKYQP